MNFLNVAAGSAAEAGYLCDVAGRLGFLAPTRATELATRYGEVCASLKALMSSLEPKAQSPRSKV